MLLVSDNFQLRGHEHVRGYFSRISFSRIRFGGISVVRDRGRVWCGQRRPDRAAGPGVFEQLAREGPCPECGVVSARVKQRPLVRLSDVPASGQRVMLWWHKRRLVCAESLCRRRSFTQTAVAVWPRARLTERLRDQLARAIAVSNRSVAEVAAEYGVSWPTAHKALVVASTRWLPEPTPTTRLGIDETRARFGPLGPRRCWMAAVRSMDDLVRRLLHRRDGSVRRIVAGAGSWTIRWMCAGLARAAV